MATLAEAGAEMLLLEAWHVSVAPKSSRLTWGTDRVFWTVCPNVFSKLESIKWLSRHQVTWGMGSPKNRKKISLYWKKKRQIHVWPRVHDLELLHGIKIEVLHMGLSCKKKKKKDENYRKRGFYWLLGLLHKKIGRSMNYVMQLRSNKGLFILNVSFEIFSNGQ